MKPLVRLSILSCVLILVSSKCSNNNHALVLGPVVSPEDNPMTDEKVALGRLLFFDKRLSRDNTISCASCRCALWTRHTLAVKAVCFLGFTGVSPCHHAHGKDYHCGSEQL